mmetsp:Transcript_37553/g.52949  ORF Transcript_37553/g.52949 Transcript_37553/m.52949 type:complete len:82 (-) Transcript_37553:112-357(-)
MPQFSSFSAFALTPRQSGEDWFDQMMFPPNGQSIFRSVAPTKPTLGVTLRGSAVKTRHHSAGMWSPVRESAPDGIALWDPL